MLFNKSFVEKIRLQEKLEYERALQQGVFRSAPDSILVVNEKVSLYNCILCVCGVCV